MLKISDVSKVFPASRRSGEVVALRDINLEIPKGQFIALVGPSGCGKSTLLNLIAGISRPSTGQVGLNGAEIVGPSPLLGVMFQQYHLFPWMTVRGNVEFGPRARGAGRSEATALVDRYVTMVGLAGFEGRYPHELSGGMQQRCALARMLVNDPLVLLMDEPLAAVDAQTRNILQEELLAIWGDDQPRDQRRTVVFVTHAIEEAVYLADRIIVMGRKPGRVIADILNTIPRPRLHARRTPAFGELVDSIWGQLREQAAEATRQ